MIVTRGHIQYMVAYIDGKYVVCYKPLAAATVRPWRTLDEIQPSDTEGGGYKRLEAYLLSHRREAAHGM